MKKELLYILFINLIFISSIQARSINKIAIVNIARVFQQIPQRILVVKKLENEFKDRAAELQFMEHDLQTQMRRLQRDGSTMQISARNALEKSVMMKRKAFSTKAQIFEHDNRLRETEERNKILMHIQNAVKNIAIKHGYDMVIDANVIAYAGNVIDITHDVLKQVK